jgi:hypothetical protein
VIVSFGARLRSQEVDNFTTANFDTDKTNVTTANFTGGLEKKDNATERLEEEDKAVTKAIKRLRATQQAKEDNVSHNATEGIQVQDVTFTQDNAREVLCATQQAETTNFQFIHNIIYHNTEGLSHWLDHDGVMSVTGASEEIVTVPSHTSTRDFYGITLIAEEQGNWSKNGGRKGRRVVGGEWKGVNLVADERACAERKCGVQVSTLTSTIKIKKHNHAQLVTEQSGVEVKNNGVTDGAEISRAVLSLSPPHLQRQLCGRRVALSPGASGSTRFGVYHKQIKPYTLKPNF